MLQFYLPSSVLFLGSAQLPDQQGLDKRVEPQDKVMLPQSAQKKAHFGEMGYKCLFL